MKGHAPFDVQINHMYRNVSSRGGTNTIHSEVILKGIDLILQEQITHMDYLYHK